MAKVDLEFHNLCRTIFEHGREYENMNRGVKRLQIPSYTFRHSFADGFPAMTNKQLYWKGIVGELIWFLRGDNDVTYLNENGIKIWNKDAYNWYRKQSLLEGCPEDKLESLEDFEQRGEGSVGQNYSVQWRAFNGRIDQITTLIKEMKHDIMSSRLKVNAWNPAELNDTALPPCHSEFQVIGVPLTDKERILILADRTDWERSEEMNELLKLVNEGNAFTPEGKELTLKACDALNVPYFGFELHWNQRSVDTFLGLPFNVASYGLLAKILEGVTGYPALGIEGTLKCVHFYDNQYDAAKELLERNPEQHANCELQINQLSNLEQWDSPSEIFDKYQIADFTLVGYTSDKPIKVDMLAPKEL